MNKSDSAAEYLPANFANLSQLRRSAAKCKGCDLYLPATQTAFGKGNAEAKVILVGEQPGDKEDLVGESFFGPAGQLLDKALAEAQIDTKAIYVTNAVKHFKFEERCKRRIHKKPKTVEIEACSPWLEAEIATIEPQLIVSMGATDGGERHQAFKLSVNDLQKINTLVKM